MSATLGRLGTLDGDTPLHAVSFTVVDLETTGGSPQTCAIAEVGAVRVRGGEREGEVATLVRPGMAIPRQIRDALHDALSLRRCTLRIGRATQAPACALAEIGRCCAPCTGRVRSDVYAPVVEQARAALGHGGGTTAAWLVDRMEQLSDVERYHEARWRRDRLRALAEAALRQRTSDALVGVALAAWRRQAMARPMAISDRKVTTSTTRSGCVGKMNSQPPRNPKTYSAIASVCDRCSGTPIAPPASSPSDREMMA